MILIKEIILNLLEFSAKNKEYLFEFLEFEPES
jgi:hypothetical protein